MELGKFDDVSFFEAIESRRKSEGLSWRQLGKDLRLSPSTFSRLARGRRPDLGTFMRLLAWLNLPAETFMKGTAETPRQQDTLSAIAAALRADRAMPTGGAGAIEQLVRVVYARLAVPGTNPSDVKGRHSRAPTKRR